MSITCRALVADDEEAPREQLLAALARAWPELDIVERAANGVDAWDMFLEHEPEVCFLDIRMPGLSGIDVARRIAGRAAVVFVTAYGDHALAAFDAGAVDYLVKPVDDARLAETVARLRARLAPAAPTVPPQLEALLARLAAQAPKAQPLRTLQAGVGREVRMIAIDEVIYFESDARYTRVVHEHGDALIRTPLKELLAQLDPQQFQQVHRAVVVNLHAIRDVTRGLNETAEIQLKQRSERLPVSRTFLHLFKAE